MPTLDDVYRKFGEVAEAAQLIETELGTVLLFFDVVNENLLSPVTLKVEDVNACRNLMSRIDRQTFGQLLRNAKLHSDALEKLEPLLSDALEVRNRLSHSFYRQHNLRKATDAGRAIMIADLETMHVTLIDAFKALSLLSGIDLDKVVAEMDANRAKSDERPGVDQTSVFHLPI
jgi:hypothetical protein